MVPLSRFARRSLSLSFVTLAATLLPWFTPLSAAAQGTQLWTQSRFEEFEKGTPLGIAIGSQGWLRQGPGLREVDTTPSTFVWSVATDKSGTIYAGTGSPASVLRIKVGEKPFTLFDTKDVSVQVVRIGPDGALYVATLPSGKVYKLDPNATEKKDASNATIVFDASKAPGAKPVESGTKAHYIWDMTFDAEGRLYIATGGPPAIYRVDVRKVGSTPEEFFHCDEAHIRALAWDAKGNLIAGTDGSGLVYRISPAGKGYVLFEAPHREITSVAVAPDGTIYAANVGDKSRNPLPPLAIQGVGSVTITIVQPGSLQAANSSATLPEGSEIYTLVKNKAPRKLWSQKSEVVYALSADKDGLLALAGNRGHIFRIQPDGSYEDVAHIDAQEGVSFAHDGSGKLLIGTGNTGKIVELGSVGTHAYASDVLDAGAFARFGRMEIEPGSTGYTLYTRTGNVEQPARGRGDWGWSDWEPVKDGAVASAAGRYLQWKVELANGGKIGSVGVNYLPVNSAPVVDNIIVVPGARVNAQNAAAQQQTVSISFPTTDQSSDTSSSSSQDSGNSTPLNAQKDKTSITVRWAAHDDNDDDLEYSLFLRGDGEHIWRLLKGKITDKNYSFDATLIPDGGYQVKVVASDAPSHTPGEALTGDIVSDRFVIDTTPPVVSNVKAVEEAAACTKQPCGFVIHATFDGDDATSPIAHAEYSLDAGDWQYVAPVGELSDSQKEHYDFNIPGSALKGRNGEHLLTVRVYDRYDNIGLAKTTFTAAHAANTTAQAQEGK
ncbi:MAG: hypothetical protein KGN79_03420 [Acidobacteriota bacterium]|nr:hypothetical protein [Acidobacteriota bacterium]